ncbi:MAG: 4Fe-4S binding protein [Candidatus Thermoplasmatota archaeon]|nr:4Fe-4S binding protein [Candidatus Thermoplasmatota archaeon]
MATRKIINIDEKKCDGCGACIPNCPEGAIQIINGKARLISDIFCDGLGACLGHCPKGAISITEREAKVYDEKKVMKNIVKQGENTIIAHLKHLRDHGETTYLAEALEYLKENNIDIFFEQEKKAHFYPEGCPSAQSIDLSISKPIMNTQGSHLQQWPVQMHLISPDASVFQGSDLLLAADCVAYAVGDFHQRFLSKKTLAIACPKLDTNRDIYVQKLIELIDTAKINTLTVMTMQVPCCNGLLLLAQNARKQASRLIPIKHIMVNIRGEIVKEEWI